MRAGAHVGHVGQMGGAPPGTALHTHREKNTLPTGISSRLDQGPGTGASGAQIAGPVMTLHPREFDWPADRIAEARAVIADVAHHSDHLIRLACNVLAAHGDTPAERKDARVLLVVIDARRPVRRAQREDNGRAPR